MNSIEQSFRLNLSVEDAYRYLADFASYPLFMENVIAVQPLDEMRFQLRTATDDGERETEIEITELSPEKCIAWRNPNGPVSAGTLVLNPVASGRTVVTAILTCQPGEDEAQSEELRQSLSRRMQRDIARFRKLIESAEKRGSPLSMDEQEVDESSSLPRAGKNPPVTGKRKTSRNGAVKAKPQSVPGDGGNWAPPVEIAHGEKEVIVCAELPGVKREDIRIEIRGEKLTIEGERSLLRSMSEMEYRRSERPYGHFSRLIVLPDGIDARAAAASLQDGVLEIRVPRAPHAGPDASSSATLPQ